MDCLTVAKYSQMLIGILGILYGCYLVRKKSLKVSLINVPRKNNLLKTLKTKNINLYGFRCEGSFNS
jgi:hypothetical protein